MTKLRVALAMGAAVLTFAGQAVAEDFQPKEAGLWMLNLRVSGVLTNAEDAITTAAGASTSLETKVGDDVMPTVGLTYFLTDHVAIEAIAGTTQHEVKAVGPVTNVTVHKTWVLPPVVSLQYHFAPKEGVSPYVGAGVNYMLFYNGEDENGFRVDVDDGFGWALQAGVDVAVKDRWSANLDVKKVFFETDASINGGTLKSKVKLDPWVLSAGLGYRF